MSIFYLFKGILVGWAFLILFPFHLDVYLLEKFFGLSIFMSNVIRFLTAVVIILVFVPSIRNLVFSIFSGAVKK